MLIWSTPTPQRALSYFNFIQNDGHKICSFTAEQAQQHIETLGPQIISKINDYINNKSSIGLALTDPSPYVRTWGEYLLKKSEIQ